MLHPKLADPNRKMDQSFHIDDEVSFHPRYLDSRPRSTNGTEMQTNDRPTASHTAGESSNTQASVHELMSCMTGMFRTVVQEIREMKQTQVPNGSSLVRDIPNTQSPRNVQSSTHHDNSEPQHIGVRVTQPPFVNAYTSTYDSVYRGAQGNNNADCESYSQGRNRPYDGEIRVGNRRVPDYANQPNVYGQSEGQGDYRSSPRQTHQLPRESRFDVNARDYPVHSSRLATGHHHNNVNTGYDTNDARYPNSRTCNFKIPSFSGKEEWATWFARFDTIASRYNWTEDEKLDQLLPRLEGVAAEFVFTQLPPFVLNSYRAVIDEMHSRFRIIETARSFASKFTSRTQKPGETAEEFAADLKRLYDRAHGYRDRRTRDEDLVRRFLDGLRDEEVRMEVEFNKEPQNIDEAVYHVVNWVQIKNVSRGERRRRVNVCQSYEDDGDEDNWVRNVEEGRQYNVRECRKRVQPESHRTDTVDSDKIIQELQERLEKLENQLARNRRDRFPRKNTDTTGVRCYNCQQMGHYARDCPERSESRPDQRTTEQLASQIAEQSLNRNGPVLAARGRSD